MTHKVISNNLFMKVFVKCGQIIKNTRQMFIYAYNNMCVYKIENYLRDEKVFINDMSIPMTCYERLCDWYRQIIKNILQMFVYAYMNTCVYI